MKIIIVSDSHGNFGVLKTIVGRELPFDLLIHLGDGLLDLARLARVMDFNYDGVNGNSDPPGMCPVNLILKLGGHVCFFTHGDHYGVNRGLEELVEAARENKARFAFFGHTHQAFRGRMRGIEVFNPGAVCFYLSHSPGYIRWEIDVADVHNELSFQNL